MNEVFAMAQVEGGDKPLSNMKAGREVRIERDANGVINALSVTTVDNSRAVPPPGRRQLPPGTLIPTAAPAKLAQHHAPVVLGIFAAIQQRQRLPLP